MHIQIVQAHNEPQSFNAAMKNLAVDELCSQGHSVEVSDLYAMRWNPVASAADFCSRANPEYLTYAMEQRHNHSHHSLAPDIQGELEKLLKADLVILNFPIYWFSMPAIMKGWIDRVLVSGVCYGGKRFYDQGGLLGKKAMLAITLGGQPHMFSEDGVHGDLNDMLRPILRGTLAYSGMAVLPPFCGSSRTLYLPRGTYHTAGAVSTALALIGNTTSPYVRLTQAVRRKVASGPCSELRSKCSNSTSAPQTRHSRPTADLRCSPNHRGPYKLIFSSCRSLARTSHCAA